MARRTGTAPTAAINKSWASVKAETLWTICRDSDGWFLFAGDTVEWTPSPDDEIFSTTRYGLAKLYSTNLLSKHDQRCHVARISKTVTERYVLVDYTLGKLVKTPFFKKAYGKPKKETNADQT